MSDGTIGSVDAMRALYRPPVERVLRKQLDRIDRHARRFIELSRFVVLATADPHGRCDASPRGGDPGFVQVLDERTLLLPDRPGNNRLDSLANIVGTGRVGLLFLIPGVDEMLRVNGSATLSTDAVLRDRCTEHGRPPAVVVRIGVEEVFLHCAKAVMRSGLWSAAAQVPRSVLPTMGEMQREQTGSPEPAETPDAMTARHRASLY